MSFNLSTDEKGCVIFKKEKVSAAGKKYYQYFTKVNSKDKEGNWQSAFINVAFKKGTEVNNKAKIKINSSFPTLNTYKEKTTLTWFIMEFDVLEKGEEPAKPVTMDEATGEGGFMNLDNVPGDDDFVPFL